MFCSLVRYKQVTRFKVINVNFIFGFQSIDWFKLSMDTNNRSYIAHMYVSVWYDRFLHFVIIFLESDNCYWILSVTAFMNAADPSIYCIPLFEYFHGRCPALWRRPIYILCIGLRLCFDVAAIMIYWKWKKRFDTVCLWLINIPLVRTTHKAFTSPNLIRSLP